MRGSEATARINKDAHTPTTGAMPLGPDPVQTEAQVLTQRGRVQYVDKEAYDYEQTLFRCLDATYLYALLVSLGLPDDKQIFVSVYSIPF